MWALGGSRRHPTLFFDPSSSSIAFPVGGHQKIDNMVKLGIESGYDSCLQFKYYFWYFLAIFSFFWFEKKIWVTKEYNFIPDEKIFLWKFRIFHIWYYVPKINILSSITRSYQLIEKNVTFNCFFRFKITFNCFFSGWTSI